MRVFPPAVIDRDGLHKCEPARPARGALGLPAGGRLPRRRLQARADRAAAPGGRRRRHEERRDRRRLDRREGDARPLHARRRRALSRLRLRLARRLHHAVAQRSRARARAVRDPPPLVAGACATSRTTQSSKLAGRLGTRPSVAQRCWYRLRGYRILDDERAGSPATSSTSSRAAGARWSFCEVKSKAGDGLRRPARDGRRRRRSRRVRRAAEAWLATHPELDRLDVRFDVVAVRGARASSTSPTRSEETPVASVELVGCGGDAGSALRRPRPRSLVVASASCPSASGRSTSIACIRISASTSRSSSRSCSGATSLRGAACSTRSPARARRSSRRSRAASTRPASTSPRSTAC